MAIVNRDLDSSQQLYAVERVAGAVGISAATIVGSVPSAGQMLGIQIAAKGLSGSPVYSPNIRRWTSAGVTVIPLGANITVAAAYGVSGGMVGASFAADSSLAALQQGDLIELISSGANSAVTDLVASAVIKATQDIKRTHGLS